jgi:hypothetical protein
MILTANGVLASLKNSFKYWTPENFRKLYTAFFRPHLEYCTPVWNPTLKKDILRLERVQRRATKILPCLRNLDYSARLTAIDITTLKTRRDRGDLFQMLKFTSKHNAVTLEQSRKILEPAIGRPGDCHSRLTMVNQLHLKFLFQIAVQTYYYYYYYYKVQTST